MPRRDVMPRPLRVKWQRVVANACTRKVAYDDPADARRALGADRVHRVYRCPFSEQRHWHIGRVPDMKTLRGLASAIRARAQETR